MCKRMAFATLKKSDEIYAGVQNNNSNFIKEVIDPDI
jgi:hypothetical protein